MATTDSLPQPELKKPEDYLLPFSVLFRGFLLFPFNISVISAFKNHLLPDISSSPYLTYAVVFILPALVVVAAVALHKNWVIRFIIASDLIVIALIVGFAAAGVDFLKYSQPSIIRELCDLLPECTSVMMLMACEVFVFLKLKWKVDRSFFAVALVFCTAFVIGHTVQTVRIRHAKRLYKPMIAYLNSHWIKLPEHLVPAEINVNENYCAAGFQDKDSDIGVGFCAWKHQGRWQYQYLSIGEPHNPRYDKKWTRTIAESELGSQLPYKSKLNYIGTKPARSQYASTRFVFYSPKYHLYYEISNQGTYISSAAKLLIDGRATRFQSPPQNPTF